MFEISLKSSLRFEKIMKMIFNIKQCLRIANDAQINMFFEMSKNVMCV